MKKTIICCLAAILLTAFANASEGIKVKIDTGAIDGISYRVDIPDDWNHILLVYYHGYSTGKNSFDNSPPRGAFALLTGAGYAIAQSDYSETGWALDAAILQTERLRTHVISQYGKPIETYVFGHSMGGLLATETLEEFPNRYDGGLSLCGLLAPTTWELTQLSARRAAFDYYYPGVLPNPVDIPDSKPIDHDVAFKMLQSLSSNPKGHSEMLAIGHFKTDEDMVNSIILSTIVLRDLEQKIGSSVINNDAYIYAGGSDDNVLNDGVKRYTASDAALGYMKSHYTPTGVLLRPMLAVHTTYDPTFFSNNVSIYADQVQRSGSIHNFVQQYVKHDGHCAITPEETLMSIEELVHWKQTGERPLSGPLPTSIRAR